jgi:acyl-CoA synthetase (AMP-forming)/AMP-acid ligase II
VFDANDARPTDVVLGCLPLFHTFGQTVGMNGTFRLGATLVMLARFTGPAALELMVREGVYPREVEEVLARHPAVAQVAVIGVPDPVHGEEICAVVVPTSAPVPAEELIAWSREHLGRHKYPRQVRFVDALPLGPSHKVLKRELRRTVVSQRPPSIGVTDA